MVARRYVKLTMTAIDGDRHLLDVALHGAVGANPAGDTRDPLTVARIVCDELARGSDVESACAAAIVDPARYLGWVHDRDDVATLHNRAQRIRASLLAEEPLRLAREIGRARAARGAMLGHDSLVKSVVAEAGLSAKAPGVGQATAADSQPTIRIVFDALPTHPQSALPSDEARQANKRLSAAEPATYAVIEPDELDD